MNNKPNYNLKAKVIENGMANQVRKMSLTFFKKYQEDKRTSLTGEIIEEWKPMTLGMAKLMQQMFLEEYPEEFKECQRVNHAYYNRVGRLKDKIKEMLLSGQCIFLTLTFTNSVLDSTNEDTRKRYVKRCLKNISNVYIANIDYGSKNEREHYHAIVLCDRVDFKVWKYGNIDFEKIIITEDASKKLAKYVSKLTNHAIKTTTRRNCVIYSR